MGWAGRRGSGLGPCPVALGERPVGQPSASPVPLQVEPCGWAGTCSHPSLEWPGALLGQTHVSQLPERCCRDTEAAVPSPSACCSHGSCGGAKGWGTAPASRHSPAPPPTRSKCLLYACSTLWPTLAEAGAKDNARSRAFINIACQNGSPDSVTQPLAVSVSSPVTQTPCPPILGV